MSLPACFQENAPFTDASADARTLITLDRQSYPAWRDAQTASVQAWLDGHGYDGSGGNFLALPESDGQLRRVVVGVTDGDDPLTLAHLPMLLPDGLYRLDAASPLPIDPALALLGWGLGAYQFARYLAKTKPVARLLLSDVAEVSEALALLSASLLARDLVNTPTEHMGPAELEGAARQLAHAHGATVTAIIGDELLAQNFPTIHAVGRASHRAPRLIELEWGDPAHPRIAVVGKGVCFDTGGLDIKGSDGMRNMKKDMGGGAHALALAHLVMSQRLPVHLTVLVPAVENAIAGNAFRPGEVIVTRQGLSVEIDNTDAEGRLVLCDALTYAAEKNPALLLDFATLTGSARTALGPDIPALFCNDEALAADYLAAGERMRDQIWRMPLWRPYLGMLHSNIADLGNAGHSRLGGAITAALYLERFVPDGLPWAHLDQYAWNDSARPGKPAGGEAQGLRAAYALLRARYPKH
jgi:leucyl aminopeptidase